MSEEQRFFEGDVLELRGYFYEVTRADAHPDGGILQYRLEPTDVGPPDEAPPATLRVHDDGYSVAMYYEANPVVVE